MRSFPSLARAPEGALGPAAGLPPEQCARGTVELRYEDVAQDGALKIGGMPHAIGMVCFRKLWVPTEIQCQTRAKGVLPILSRMILQATGGPISVYNTVEVEAAYQLGHTRDASGEVSRILLNMTAELFGPQAHTHDPQGRAPGARIHVGRVFAEHVFTRPLGPTELRKVTALEIAGQALVPGVDLAFHAASATLELPEGARFIEPGFAPDSTPFVFGLTHTDANQHVNSLVYPQLFEDAALRRLHALGHDTRALLVDHLEIAFRKPSFAGQRMTFELRAFELEEAHGAVAYLGPAGCNPQRAHCTCLLTFRRGELQRAG